MGWLLIVGTTWTTLAGLLAVLVGRSVRLADRREAAQFHLLLPDFVPENWPTAPAERR